MDSNRKRVAVANIAAAGFISVGAAVAFAATAAADPPPPPDPALPLPADPAPPAPAGPTVPGIGQLGPPGLGVLAQTGQEGNPGALRAPPIIRLDQTTVLGQNAVASAPGAGPSVVPNLNVFNNAYA